MDFAFTQAQEDVAGLARAIFADHRDDSWPFLAAAGVLGTAVPEDDGGNGGGLLELCALLEEQGRATAEAPLWAALCGAGLPLAAFGTPAQRQRLLRPLAGGEALVTCALADEAPATAAREGDDLLVSGVRNCVPAAERAQRVLVPTDAGLALVDPRAPGVSLEPQVVTTGEVMQRMTLVRARVAPEDVLGAPLEWLLPRATVGLCALQLGVAERALAMTASYTSTRRQFDRPIATFQAVAQRAADAYIDVEAMRVTLWAAAWLLAEGRDDEAGPAVSVAKLWAGEAGHRVVYAAQHLHGGIGFDASYPLGRGYLWSRQLELTLGSPAAHLARLGAALAQRKS